MFQTPKIPAIRTMIITFVLMAFTPARSFALNAPFLTSLISSSSHTATLFWRNNDVAASKVLILRKKTPSPWGLIDSVDAANASYTDSTVRPSSVYSYALIATAGGTESDTSNVLTVTTPAEPEVFTAAIIAVSWVEGRNYISIQFYDSSTVENGFRLFRKTPNNSWMIIDSIISASPDSHGMREFRDSSLLGNMWYSYKVQTFMGDQVLFSPETTVYNYVAPQKNKSYVFSKKGSIPAHPISWIEKIGDSLFFPEIKSPGDTGISIINISDPMNPLFMSYITPLNLPANLKNTPVGARMKLNYLGHESGYYLTYGVAGFFQFDSTSLFLRDSIGIYYSAYATPSFIGWLNDTCGFFQLGRDQRYAFSAQPIHFGIGGIDTFSTSMTWHTSPLSQIGWKQFWGCYNNKAVVTSLNGGDYSLIDFSADFNKPLFFSCSVQGQEALVAESMVLDTSIVFALFMINGSGITLSAFDIADAHFGPNQSILGKLADSTFSDRSIKKIIVDTQKKNLIVFGETTLAMYSYSREMAGVKKSNHGPALPSNRFLLSRSSCGVRFALIDRKLIGLQIFNIKGRCVRTMNSHTDGTVVWDGKDSNGAPVPAGCYIFKLAAKDGGLISGSILMVR
jgi:hypothetical protein